EAEGTIAVDPTNPSRLFASSNQDMKPGRFAAYSTDGGATWTGRTLGTGAAGDGLPTASTDPEAVFDQYGNLFVTYIDFDDDTTVDVLLSTDGGKTFRALDQITGDPDESGVDQTKIAVGPGPNGGGSVWLAFR